MAQYRWPYCWQVNRPSPARGNDPAHTLSTAPKGLSSYEWRAASVGAVAVLNRVVTRAAQWSANEGEAWWPGGQVGAGYMAPGALGATSWADWGWQGKHRPKNQTDTSTGALAGPLQLIRTSVSLTKILGQGLPAQQNSRRAQQVKRAAASIQIGRGRLRGGSNSGQATEARVFRNQALLPACNESRWWAGDHQSPSD